MLKIGVIGLGAMGKNHARVCSEIDNVNLAGVSDINKAISKNLADKFDLPKELLKSFSNVS